MQDKTGEPKENIIPLRALEKLYTKIPWNYSLHKSTWFNRSSKASLVRSSFHIFKSLSQYNTSFKVKSSSKI
jgi:hypothetical protein